MTMLAPEKAPMPLQPFPRIAESDTLTGPTPNASRTPPPPQPEIEQPEIKQRTPRPVTTIPHELRPDACSEHRSMSVLSAYTETACEAKESVRSVNPRMMLASAPGITAMASPASDSMTISSPSLAGSRRIGLSRRMPVQAVQPTSQASRVRCPSA
ncbi:hypothetical protein T492DRAFT_1037173 [Pavlovales sp. CCMP2436]|nr:hypothetical protein T492DRAFT_1037173 [Pavlovales sp. CCMP2436]